MAGRWLDVGDAAQELGISTDAVRKRIARGSLRSDRENGSVRVWLDDGGTEAGREGQVDSEALVEVLRDQVDYLRAQLDAERRANDENRRLLAGLIERVPALEAPTDTSAPTQRHEVGTQEPAEAAPTPAPGPGATPRTDEPRSPEKPWWRRVFGG
jgi:hypothetical protein